MTQNKQSSGLAKNLKVREVYGSARNVAALGSPVEHMYDAPVRYYYYPAWRSQILELCAFFALCWLAIRGSQLLPWLVVPGKLFNIGETTVYLYLPLLSLLPGFMLGKILFFLYNSKYIIDERGVEAQVGLVSLSLRQPRVRYEDIRGVEPVQRLHERFLGIGMVLIGSAAQQDVEIRMIGIPNPRSIQLLIQGERDRRMRYMQKGGGANEKEEYLIGD